MEKTPDDQLRERSSNTGSINMVVWMLAFLIDHFIKSDWFYLIYGLLAIALINAVILVRGFYKALAKRDQFIRFNRIRANFIFQCFMSVLLIFLLVLQISIHSRSI